MQIVLLYLRHCCAIRAQIREL